MRIKKTLARNKQAKLEPFDNNKIGDNYKINNSYHVLLSQSRNRRMSNNDNRFTSIGNSHRGSVDMEDDGLRMKTEPMAKCLMDMAII